MYDTPVFTLNTSISDGLLTGGMVLIDQKPLTQYVPSFGGTFTFTGMTFVLEDGTEVVISDGTVEIVLEKDNNEFLAEEAVLAGDEDFEYTSTNRIITLTIGGPTPLIVLFDLVLSYILMGLGIVFLVLLLLQWRRRIDLVAMARKRRAADSTPPPQ